MGEDPTFADVTAVATLNWLKRISGEGSTEWLEIFSGGRGPMEESHEAISESGRLLTRIGRRR